MLIFYSAAIPVNQEFAVFKISIRFSLIVKKIVLKFVLACLMLNCFNKKIILFKQIIKVNKILNNQLIALEKI